MQRINDFFKHNASNKIAIIGIPYDVNSSFMRGPAGAPPFIRKALFSDASNLWTEKGVDLSADDVMLDMGDLTFNQTDDPMTIIETSLTRLLDDKFLPIALGGDHAITYPLIRGFRNKYNKLSLLQFDAHPDLYHELQDNRYSHASTFARIMEDKLVDRLIQVGVRTMNGHQRSQAEKFGVEVVDMLNWRDDIQLAFDSPVYISFDMDVLDPAYAPGVSHREPGGLSPRQLISLIHSLKGPVIGADIVEYNPKNDLSEITSMVSAKILKEIAAQVLLTRAPSP
ncbi:MAG: agmatinase [Desulfobacterales bacterium]|nr:MAG: agmatinase [Desulfobacterales bacterium]